MKLIKNSLLTALALLLASTVMVSAGTSTWTGAGLDALFTNPANWTPSWSAPALGDTLIFPGPATAYAVDLTGAGASNGPITFSASSAYSFTPVTETLTLGGDISQNGSGAVTFDNLIDLGGANRTFTGTGSGVVTFNGAVTDTAAAGVRSTLNGGNYVIANAANTIDRWEVNNGAKATIVGTGTVPDYPTASYFGGNGSGGGFYVNLDGGVLDYQATETMDPPSWGDGSVTATVLSDWIDRAVVFGPNGGTVVFNKSGVPSANSPTVWISQGGTSTVVVGEPLPYGGDYWANPLTWRSPFEVEYGVALGIFQNGSGYAYGGTFDPTTVAFYKWRQGTGDFQLILTNGASAYLDWNAMTNGNFIIRGHPGGDSSVIETNATGWTRNVGRFAIRGPHRNGQQYTNDLGAPLWLTNGVISRSFYMPQPYAMKFYDAVQVWNRDGLERLACDMSFEPGSSVDICGGRRSTGLDLGHCGNLAIVSQNTCGPTNTMTIKSGAKCNLNLQLRSSIADSGTCPRGEGGQLRVWSFIDIKDGGQLKIYRSQTNGAGLTETEAGDTGGSSSRSAVKCIELFRPIIGEGNSASDARFVLDLPWSPKSNVGKDSGNSSGTNGVNFEANPNGLGGSWPGAMPIVNGTGRYGLRLEGKAEYLTNFLYAVRNPTGGSAQNALAGLTGSGGVFTLAATDTTGSLTISDGPVSNPNSVRLGFIGNPGFTYIVNAGAAANFGGLLVKQGRVKLGNGLNMTGKNLRVGDEGVAEVALDDSATATMNQLVLVGDTTLEMGTAGGSGAVMNFASTSSAVWTAGKTLTIKNWNGNIAGGGPDQIFFGADATGLTASQLAQIKWLSPFGGGDITGARILPTGEIVPLVVPTIGSPAPAIVGGELQFGVVSPVPSQATVVQRATNLTAPIYWENLQTNTGSFTFTNSGTSLRPESFFRLRILP